MLFWLQENNQLCNDINVCEDWETYWEEDDADLWNAMTRACEEQSIVDQVIDNSDTATGSLNECHVSKSDTTLSLSPIGNDYQLLTHLARRHA